VGVHKSVIEIRDDWKVQVVPTGAQWSVFLGPMGDIQLIGSEETLRMLGARISMAFVRDRLDPRDLLSLVEQRGEEHDAGLDDVPPAA
jgi:hypothetical protein